VLSTWRAEAERFRPDLAISTYHGAGRALDPNADLTITSYALLRLDVDALAEQRFDMLVLDEAQAIKNPDSAVAQAAARLDAGVRLAMTGTPIENRLEELWSQLRVTCPGLLWDRATFAERIERPARRGDVQAFARLRERAGPFVLRRLKRDVARELPPRDEVVLRCDLSEEERAVYEALHAATRRDVVARLDAGAGVMEALEALLRLRQAACHPALVPGSGFPASRPSSKLELLVERLAQIVDEGHKALVFSQWTSLLDLVEPQLAARGLGALRLDGRTRDRATVVRSFQEGGGEGERALLLMTLKAGGVGLTLTAADHVLLLDPWWNPAAEEQAIDRTHRIGQERPVLTHRIVAAGTVEEGILALQDSKRRTARAALEGPGAAEEVGTRSAGLTREELVALLD
jgi:SNF2 family DNA or RNA helicase